MTHIDGGWIDEFRELARSRLQAIFEKDLNGIPREIGDRLAALHRKEQMLSFKDRDE